MSLNWNITVLTLNCWGLPLFSKNRAERMSAIADELATGKYEVVCLQEVWSHSDFLMIQTKTKHVLPYSHYFHSGVTGSGVCMLSKFVIEEVFFHQWPVNGYIHKIQHGDWFGGKGIALCRLSYNGLNIFLYNTHLHAEYNPSSDEYKAHRVLQAFDLSQVMRLTSSGADIAILAGDLNSGPDDLATRIILHNTGLQDSYIPTQQEDLTTGNSTSEVNGILEFSKHGIHDYSKGSGTNNAHRNTFSEWAGFKEDLSKRIDYIMYRPGQNVEVKVEKYCQPFPDHVPNHDFSYSDHEAVLTIFSISRILVSPDDGRSLREKEADKKRMAALKEGLNVCNEALKDIYQKRRWYGILSATLLVLLLSTLGSDAPYFYVKLYNLIRAMLTVILTYSIVMTIVWHHIELHNILAGKLSIEVVLNHLNCISTSQTSKQNDDNVY